MEEKNLKTSFEESQQKNEDYFSKCKSLIEENDLDNFLKDVVLLLKKFKSESLASFACAYIWQAVAQAIKQTVQEDGKSS